MRLLPLEMGALVSKALRPIKTFNIENRAHRVISKEKPSPAPQYAATLLDIKRATDADPQLDDKIQKKNQELDNWLKKVYVTSEGRPEDDITREIQQNPNKILPQDRKPVESFDYGLKEPERISYGKTTLRNAISFITAHQTDPKEASTQKIALEYKLKEEDVENILKYFQTFEVYYPATKTSQAQFAGPSQLRLKLEEEKRKLLEDEAEVKNKVKPVRKGAQKTVLNEELESSKSS